VTAYSFFHGRLAWTRRQKKHRWRIGAVQQPEKTLVGIQRLDFVLSILPASTLRSQGRHVAGPGRWRSLAAYGVPESRHKSAFFGLVRGARTWSRHAEEPRSSLSGAIGEVLDDLRDDVYFVFRAAIACLFLEKACGRVRAAPFPYPTSSHLKVFGASIQVKNASATARGGCCASNQTLCLSQIKSGWHMAENRATLQRCQTSSG
jgi:hypothetical protein